MNAYSENATHTGPVIKGFDRLSEFLTGAEEKQTLTITSWQYSRFMRRDFYFTSFCILRKKNTPHLFAPLEKSLSEIMLKMEECIASMSSDLQSTPIGQVTPNPRVIALHDQEFIYFHPLMARLAKILADSDEIQFRHHILSQRYSGHVQGNAMEYLLAKFAKTAKLEKQYKGPALSRDRVPSEINS